MVSAAGKITNVLTKIMKYIMIALLAWMVLSLGIQVVARYVFHKSFVWSEESARYCMIWMVFIGATEIVFNSDHIKVTIIEDALKGFGKKVLLVVQDIICLVFSVMLAAYSFPQVALSAKAVSANMDINMGIVFAIFPVVTTLMILGYALKILLRIVGNTPTDAAEQGGEQT